MFKSFTSVIFLLYSTLVVAEIYKCESSSGDSYYSDNVCSENEQSEEVKLNEGNSIEGSSIHYKFENSNYKSKAYMTYHDVESQYACAGLCNSDSKCLAATFYNGDAPKRKRYQCRLRKIMKNKQVNEPGAVSWVK